MGLASPNGTTLATSSRTGNVPKWHRWWRIWRESTDLDLLTLTIWFKAQKKQERKRKESDYSTPRTTEGSKRFAAVFVALKPR
jgi:hypothetical protein